MDCILAPGGLTVLSPRFLSSLTLPGPCPCGHGKPARLVLLASEAGLQVYLAQVKGRRKLALQNPVFPESNLPDSSLPTPPHAPKHTHFEMHRGSGLSSGINTRNCPWMSQSSQAPQSQLWATW